MTSEKTQNINSTIECQKYLYTGHIFKCDVVKYLDFFSSLESIV